MKMSKKLVGKARAKARKRLLPTTPKRVPNMGNMEDLYRGIWNASPTMIHEDKYIPMDCVLCGETMMSVHDTHDARPLKETCSAKESLETGNPNRCCSKCNTETVSIARLSSIGIDVENEDVVTKEITVGEFLKLQKEGKIVNFPYHTGTFH